MSALALVRKGIKKEMRLTLKSIDARKAKHDKVAISLGFKNAQEAFKSMGKEFLTIANS